MSKNTCFTDEHTCVSTQTRLRVYVQNVSVYTGTTRHMFQHVCALCQHTRGCFEPYTRVFSSCHTPHTTPQHNTQHNTTQHTTPHTAQTTQTTHHTPRTHGDRERQTEKERDRERRQRRQDNRREKRERRFIFSVVVHGRSLLMESFFYTLRRDEKSIDPKGWIRGNIKIGPVLEVTTSYLQDKYGVEIKIESVKRRRLILTRGSEFPRSNWSQT